MDGIIRAWGKILSGYRPNLSIEITRECPLRCPGCYAYGDEHLGGGQTLRALADRKGQALIDGILEVVERQKPLHVSLVGGEPLVRYRELDVLLPQLSARGFYVQVVTSAVRPIPVEWASIPRLQICVSIDGLQPEHDVRRAPATYDRILKHIEGHQITVHCTVTRQQIAARRLHRDVHPHVVRQSQRAHDLDEPVHAAGGRSLRRAAARRRSLPGRGRAAAAPSALPEAADAQRAARRVPGPALVHRRTASSRRPPTACRRTSTRASRRASSAARPTARAAAASRRRASRRWGGTGCVAACEVGALFDGSLDVGRAVSRLRGDRAAPTVPRTCRR